MINEIDKEIEKLIYTFFTEMNEWEKFCLQIEEDEDIPYNEEVLKQRSKAKEIVDKFFTIKDRKRGLPNCISYGEEGSYRYNPDEEKILTIEIQDSKATVTTKRKKPMQESNIYITKKIKDTWLIDSKKSTPYGKKNGKLLIYESNSKIIPKY